MRKPGIRGKGGGGREGEILFIYNKTKLSKEAINACRERCINTSYRQLDNSRIASLFLEEIASETGKKFCTLYRG